MENKIIFDVEKYRDDRKAVMTAEELAEKLNITATQLKTYEYARRKNIPLEEYKALCDAAGLSYEDYLVEVPAEEFIYRRPTIITILTNKGGAGKTTLAVNLAGALVSDCKKKCLVIDTDLQQNTTMHLGMLYPLDDSVEEAERIARITEETKEKNIYNAFVKKDDIQKHILHTNWENLDVVVSCDAMSTINKEMYSMQLGELRMQAILKKLINENPECYDFVIIDCNPDLSQINEAALFASDYVIIPLEATAFGLRGVQYVIDFYQSVKEQREELDLLGIMLNKYDGRKNITKDISEALFGDEYYQDKVFDTKVPVDTSIEQAQSFGEPLFVSFGKSKASKAYKTLAHEVLDRIKAKG
ncbi:MAG: AAA family ATPase [Bacteroidales bacterium]|nr:AAA family ATPase [Bacteroidales bacterium]